MVRAMHETCDSPPQAGTALGHTKGFCQVFHEDLGHSACHC